MKLFLVGDISPTVATYELFKNKDINTLFTDTTQLFLNNDINFVNLECAITDCETQIRKMGPALKAPYETAEVLRDLGVTCVGVSNNHFFDFGIKGVRDSIKALSDVNLPIIGFGENYEDSRKNYIYEKDGERICIIAVCEHEYSYALEDRMGTRPVDEIDTIEDVRKAKETFDKVIVIYHGGKEYCQYPSPRLRKLCQALARNGADVIIGQHSHCICCYEKYNNSHILYGQGNFHFVKQVTVSCYSGLDIRKIWNESLAVKYDTKTNEIEFVPIVTYDNKGITIAKGEQKAEIIKSFENRNEQLKNGEWKQKWHEHCLTIEEEYRSSIKKFAAPEFAARYPEIFAHCLDCEAHTDVWRELFKTRNYTNEK